MIFNFEQLNSVNFEMTKFSRGFYYLLIRILKFKRVPGQRTRLINRVYLQMSRDLKFTYALINVIISSESWNID